MLHLSFREHINHIKQHNIHPRLDNTLDKYASFYKKKPVKNKHLILYGPNGVGKYTQMLYLLSKIDENALHTDTKVGIQIKNKTVHVRTSNIHCEVDMQLLGCNAKCIWYNVYNHLLDIISSSMNQIRFIVCRNFEDIHAELLDIFYFFMRNISSTPISFILITNSVCFIPKQILQLSESIQFKRPNNTHYKFFQSKTKWKPNEINNIQYVHDSYILQGPTHRTLANRIIPLMKDRQCSFISLREAIYDLFTYHINIHNVLLYIIQELKRDEYIHDGNEDTIVSLLESFYEKYYNNYRAIFHVEKLLLEIIQQIAPT